MLEEEVVELAEEERNERCRRAADKTGITREERERQEVVLEGR